MFSLVVCIILSLLFSKSTVEWGGVTAEVTLTTKNCKEYRGGVVFLVEKKMICLDFDGATRPGYRYLALDMTQITDT
jgi:hypothetical protein